MDAADQKLEEAARYLEKHGWHRGSRKGEKVCIIVALAEVCRLHNTPDSNHPDFFNFPRADVYYDALLRLRNAIKPNFSLAHWNDHVCQSPEEAIGALRKARSA